MSGSHSCSKDARCRKAPLTQRSLCRHRSHIYSAGGISVTHLMSRCHSKIRETIPSEGAPKAQASYLQSCAFGIYHFILLTHPGSHSQQKQPQSPVTAATPNLYAIIMATKQRGFSSTDVFKAWTMTKSCSKTVAAKVKGLGSIGNSVWWHW